MAFGATALKDDFNRANGALGSNWSNDIFHAGSVAAAIASNAVQAGSGGYSEEWWNAATFVPGAAGAEVEAWVAFSAVATGSGTGIYANIVKEPSGSVSTADGYQFEVSPNTGAVRLYRYTNSAGVSIASGGGGSTAINATMKIGLSIDSAGLIKAYTDTGSGWTQVLSVTDTTHSFAGGASIGWGIFDSGRAHRIDSFGGGTAGAGALTLDATGGSATAAGGSSGVAVTGAATGGAATAGGGSAGSSLTAAASGGAATAGGGAAAAAVTLAGSGGSATASGGAAALSTTLAASGGAATASGGSADWSLAALVLAATGGSASATGGSAGLQVTAAASGGSATAAGGAADWNVGALILDASGGSATAGGGAASIVVALASGGGDAQATGGQAGSSVTAAASGGSATAAGGSSSITFTMRAAGGSATAGGGSADQDGGSAVIVRALLVRLVAGEATRVSLTATPATLAAVRCTPATRAALEVE